MRHHVRTDVLVAIRLVMGHALRIQLLNYVSDALQLEDVHRRARMIVLIAVSIMDVEACAELILLEHVIIIVGLIAPDHHALHYVKTNAQINVLPALIHVDGDVEHVLECAQFHAKEIARSVVLKIVRTHARLTVFNHALKNVEAVVIFAIHVLACALEYALLNAGMDVHHVIQCVDGGAMIHAAGNVQLTVMIHASLLVRILALHSLHLIVSVPLDLQKILLLKDIKRRIHRIEMKSMNHSTYIWRNIMGKINKVLYKRINPGEYSINELNKSTWYQNTIGIDPKIDNEYIDYQEKQLNTRDKLIKEIGESDGVTPTLSNVIFGASSLSNQVALVVEI